jgi:hypothetical protein
MGIFDKVEKDAEDMAQDDPKPAQNVIDKQRGAQDQDQDQGGDQDQSQDK